MPYLKKTFTTEQSETPAESFIEESAKSKKNSAVGFVNKNFGKCGAQDMKNVARAGSFIFKEDQSLGKNQILILMVKQRLSQNWSIPKGRIRTESGESMIECALRETYEETGMAAEVLPIYKDKPVIRGDIAVFPCIIKNAASFEETAAVSSEEISNVDWIPIKDILDGNINPISSLTKNLIEIIYNNNIIEKWKRYKKYSNV